MNNNIFEDKIPTEEFKTKMINLLTRNIPSKTELTDYETIVKAESSRINTKQRAERYQLEIANRENQERIENLIIANTPTKYRGVSECTDEKLLNSTHAILYGSFGTGKTFEAYSCAHTLMRQQKIESFKIITEMSVLNHIRQNNDFEDFMRFDFLVIDEYGKTNQTDFSKGQIFDLLNARYEWEKKTFLICNLSSKAEIHAVFLSATLDRYKEYSRLFDGESRRVVK